MRSLLVTVVLILAAPAMLLAQPLADRVPDDAILYVGWQGSESMGPAYDASHLKAIVDASDLPALFGQFLPQVTQLAAGRDRQAARMLSIATTLGGQMWRSPCAIYFAGVDMTNPRQPMPKVAILCQAGAGAADMVNQIKQALANQPAPIDVAQADGLVTISMGLADPGKKPAAAIGANATFRQSLAQVHKQPVAVAYLDVQRLREAFTQIVQQQDPQAHQQVVKAIDALGLAGCKSVIWTGGFEAKAWSSQAFVAAPAPRTGLMSFLDSPPLTDALFKAVPSSATWVGAGHLDLEKLIGELRTAAGKIDPQAQQQIDQGLNQISQTLGRDLRKDILAPLGSEWAFYVAPTVAGNGFLGIVLVNRLDEPAKAEEALAGLEKMANDLIAANMRGGPLVQMKQTKVGDLNIHYLGTPAVAPAWAVKDGYLYIGLYPQVVASAAGHVSGKGASILQSDGFKAFRTRLGVSAPNSLLYMDLPKTAGDGYQMMLLITRYAAMSDMFGVTSPPMILPPLDKILPHLFPCGGASWTDDAGWHSKSVTPFPMSTMLAGQQGIGTMGVGSSAVAISVMLPALNSARERANRVKCASNLRQIGMGCMLYANDHRGQLPPDLGTLVLEADLSPQVFACPSGSTNAPVFQPGPDGAKVGAAWVSANSDYVYLGAGKQIGRLGADAVLAHEKPGTHGREGINILFGDGHVEWQTMPQARRTIDQSNRPAPPAPR